MSKPSEEEIKLFTIYRELSGKLSQSFPEKIKTQFQADFEVLASKLINEDWFKPPRPHKNSNFPPFRSDELPKKLDFGPLRRMAKLIGTREMRYIFDLGKPDSYSTLQLTISARKIPMTDERRKKTKQIDRRITALRFGNLVLELEEEGLSRTAAMLEARDRLRLAVSDERSLQRIFADFRKLVLDQGFIPALFETSPFPPKYSKKDLAAKVGRPKKTTTK